MATIGGADLRLDDPGSVAGAAFRAVGRVRKARDIVVDPDATVAIRPELNQIIVTFAADPGQAELAGIAHEVANRAADIASYRGDARLTLPDAHRELLTWRRADDTVVADLYLHHPGPFLEISKTVEMTLPDGTRGEPPEPPQPEWTPVMRYFRLAQTTDDLFEAYRNMYLAFEALLTELVPSATGNEGQKLRQRLQSLLDSQQLKPTLLAPKGSTDAVSAFLDDEYAAKRCALFHAKHGSKTIVPGTLAEREIVTAGLDRLTRLVLTLGRIAIGAAFSGGGLTFNEGYELMFIQPMVKGGLEILLLHDPSPLSQSQTNADVEALLHAVLETSYVGEVEPGVWGFTGTARPAPALEFDNARWRTNERLIGGQTLPLINLEGINAFNVHLRYENENPGRPRATYPR